GRHSRWDIGFVDPAIEFISRKRSFEIRALNEQGQLLLELINNSLKDCSHATEISLSNNLITGKVLEPAKHFTEEDRSKQPSIFSVLRHLQNLLAVEDERLQHFGLFGAFGYDLV